MEKYLIRGGNPLRGEVTIGGAKNAAVAILSATVLAEGVCTIENVPDIRDVYTTLKILTELGATVKFINKTTVVIMYNKIADMVIITLLFLASLFCSAFETFGLLFVFLVDVFLFFVAILTNLLS